MDFGERTERLQQLTLALGEALTEAAVAQVVLQHVVPALGASAGSISRLSPGASLLELIGWTGYSDEIELFRRFSVEQRVPHALAIKRGQPLFLEDRASMLRELGEAAQRWPRPGERDAVGAAISLPLQAGGRNLGAMGLSFPQPRFFSDDDRALALMVSQLCAQALQRAQAFEREQRARRDSESMQAQLEVLVNASAQLLGTLDQQRICQSLAELAITADLAEFASVELVVVEGMGAKEPHAPHASPHDFVLERVAAHARDPSWLALEKRRQAFPHRSAEGDAARRAVNTRALQFASVLEPTRRDELVREDAWKTVARRFHLRSRLVVPLLAGQEPLGALNLLISARAGREVSPRDLVLATELSTRAAVALHNARLYAQAREAVGLRDDFLSIAGHELRTPLTALKLQLQSSLRLLGEATDTASMAARVATVADRTEKAARQVDRLQALVDRLLDVSRISAGRFSLEPELISLNQITLEVYTRFAEEAASAGCKLTLRQCEREPLGRWDRMRVEQLLSNLLANAIKYGRGRPVEVEVLLRDGLGCVRVKDHGIGIRPADQARVFERFERATSAHRELGLGLGLWISRQIAEAHGGHIEVTSALGKGAVFLVALPLVQEAD